MSVNLRERPDSRAPCPFCREQVGEEGACCACGVTYHPECRAELSSCVTAGCAGKVPAQRQRAAPASVTVHERQDSRSSCPFCRDQVGDEDEGCACGVTYHPECRAELSRCVTIGCRGVARGSAAATAHRDVSCVRCQGLIRNDGDMCFGCWSAFHRRCLDARGCCQRPASQGDVVR